MTDTPKECRAVQPLLREHALGLLSERETRQVAAHLETCDTCRSAFEAETATLSVLDSLPDAPPPEGLADRTLRHIETATAEKQDHAPKAWFSWSLLELTTMVCVVGIVAAVFLPALARSREAARRSSCQNNLKQWGIILKMYANENQGLYPPLVSVDGVWTLDLRALYPEYLTDPNILICPSSPEVSASRKLVDALTQKLPDWDRAHQLIAHQYIYLGWVINDEATFLRLTAMPNPTPCNDLKVSDQTVYWLRDGVERLLIEKSTDPAAAAKEQSSIPIMFDNPVNFSHIPAGVNVLYLDGHVEFLRLGSQFPVTKAIWKYFGGFSSSQK